MNHCKCPYCGKKISYFTALNIRRRGEYYCNKCKKESNIVIKKTIWLLYIGMTLLALLIMAFFLLMTDRTDLKYTLYVLVPFLLIYLFSPLFVRIRPKKKFQDSLYDTEMVDTPLADPDPTMAKTAKVVPAFVDDVVLADDDYKPAINSDVFNAIKEERKVVAESGGGTKSFEKFENISSSAELGATRPVENLKEISSVSEPEEEYNDGSYDLSTFE